MNDSDSEDFFIFDNKEIDGLIKKSAAIYGRFAVARENGRPRSLPLKVPTPKLSEARWVLEGETVSLGTHKIDTGLFYFGTRLSSYCGKAETGFNKTNLENFRSLVNPLLYIEDKMRAIPDRPPDIIDYAKLTSIQRYNYIAWLESGRRAEKIQDWYPCLFLAGLERRVIYDRECGLVKKSELFSIREEVTRILKLYGNEYNKVKTVYSLFLGFLELECAERKLYSIPVPYFGPGSYSGMPAYISAALYQCARDEEPVNAELAYNWYIHSGGITKRSITMSCENEFKNLFMARYTEAYGNGFVINFPKKKSPLKKDYYSPVSSELDEVELNVPRDYGDVSGQTPFVAKLETLGDRCAEELLPYSRWSAVANKKADKNAGLLKLPPVLWPDTEREAFIRLKTKLETGPFIIKAGELKDMFFKTLPISETFFFDLAHSLETERIAFEPDILSFQIRVAAKSTSILVHILQNDVPDRRIDSSYIRARNIIELEYAVYGLCGFVQNGTEFPVKLSDYLKERISEYSYYLTRFPPPLRRCISRFSLDNAESKKSVIEYIQNNIFDGRSPSYAAVAALEKIYKGFGFPENDLHKLLHEGTDATTETPAPIELDKEKIKQLQKDSEQVATLLSGIFQDEEGLAPQKPDTQSLFPQKPDTQDVTVQNAVNKNRLNIDKAHSDFLNIIIERTEWQRNELNEMAKQNGLMLDGAIEMINEAAYVEFDEPLIEGEETIIINMEIAKMMLEKL